MSPKPAKVLNLEALLAPIPGDDPAGADLKQLRVHDKIVELRKTDDPESALGALKKGQARVADYRKVIKVCTEELSGRGKDLDLANWLADAAVREHGAGAVEDSMRLAHGLITRFWDGVYPRILEPEDLDLRAGKLEQLDALLAHALSDLVLTSTPERENFAAWEWKQVARLAEAAGRATIPDDRERAFAEVEERREALKTAVRKTPPEFYASLYADITSARDYCGELREAIEETFRNSEHYQALEEPPPTFSATRDVLDEIALLIEDFCGGPPVGAEEVATAAAPAAPVAAPRAAVAAAGAAGGGLPADPVDRADALRRLKAVASFFQKTEPHSPIAYLVQRAARWGEMPLDKWLEEVVSDSAVLDRIRETLGIRNEGQS